MCGVVAHVAWNDRGRLEEGAFAAMLNSLAHRGPDGSTVYRRDGVTLGHRRLSIIDVDGGTQPLFNETGSIACILNGEIYNFRQLRARLEAQGHQFKTHSDTEVIVHLYEELGDRAFAELEGMFVIVLADFDQARTLIVRDRMGEKPLYYVNRPDFFSCASEIRAFHQHPGVARRIDRDSLARYLRFGWIPGRSSIFQGIERLEPAHFLVLERGQARKACYWNPDLTEIKAPRAELCEMVRDAIDRTIANKLIADVPLGVFLSGGLDSSTVVAMAAKHATGRLKTFSVGFGAPISELPYARMVAQRYGTDHTEIVIDTDIAAVVDEVGRHFDEPFADNSAMPTFLISRAARQHVTVILTGDGGDELLAGYEGYGRLRAYSGNRWLSKGVRIADSAIQKLTGHSLADGLYPLPGSAPAYQYWTDLRSTYTAAQVASLLGQTPNGIDPQGAQYLRLAPQDPASRAFEFDINYYLPDDLLKKVDIAAMANSLETRAPLLDHRLVELCMRIPALEKMRGGRDKGLLREAMRPYLPPEITEREKHGFGAPVDHWLKKELNPLTRELMSDDAKIMQLLDREAVRSAVRGNMASLDSDWRAGARVWNLLMLEQWLRSFGSSISS